MKKIWHFIHVPLQQVTAVKLLVMTALFCTHVSVFADEPPKGSYKSTCHPIEYSGGQIKAQCQNHFGFSKVAIMVDANQCHGDIANINGTLRCFPAPQSVPTNVFGSYLQTCEKVEYSGGVLSASCKNKRGTYVSTTLRIVTCIADIQNDDGKLACYGTACVANCPGYVPPPPPCINCGGIPSAPATNDDGKPVVVDYRQGVSLERCYGAVGPQCQGVTGWTNAAVSRNADNSYRGWVSVGSIMHDACCRAHPDGQMCAGYNALEEVTKANYFCASEWRKATYNQRDGRNWQANFGPYPYSNSGDDVTDISPRKGALFKRLGVFESWWTGNESPATRRLAAPSGTSLDEQDEAFCESGQFSYRGSQLGVGTWGVCK